MNKSKQVSVKQWKYIIINGNHSIFDISKECKRYDAITIVYPYNGMTAVLAYATEFEFNNIVDGLMILEGM